MKIQLYLLLLFLHLILPFASSQIAETIKAPTVDKAKKLVNHKKLPAKSLISPVPIDPKTVVAQKKWNVTLSQHGISHGSDVPKNLMDSIKQAGSILMKNQALLLQDATGKEEGLAGTAAAVTPQVATGFKGNKYDYWAPPDNSLAVSDDGFIVSVINSSLFFSDENGNIILEESFDDFLAFLNLTGVYFDPRVIYDPVQDKFILVVLNGNTPATSKIVIGFSSASDPNETWWFYTFSGDPTGAGLWFDYPSIGISTDDLYISGNQFTANNNFSQALIYQLEKGPGFTGGYVNGIHWYGVQDANGINDFTVVPISHGFNTSVGPGIYFISTNGGGGSEAMMYYTDANANNNPNLHVYSFNVPNYYTPFNGLMKGTSDELKTNDCKTQSGFYADGTIHFVFSNRGDDFHTKINYCRLNTNDLTQNTLVIGQQPYEYAFPSIAPFTASATDKTVLIGFLRTSGSIYPEFRMAVVDNDLNFSGSFPVKEGESFTNFDAGTKERWGDYTGISRRHSATGAEVWISGCYGEDNDNGASNILSTWIAQIKDGGQTGAAPVAGFSASQTTVTAGQSVTFTDQSTNAPTSWTWSFSGGTPSSSAVKNPVVTYNTPGTYSVTLVAANNAGNDSETKTNYITVNAGAQPPVADFTSDVAIVSPGGIVQFEDESVNAPTFWQWSFPGGLPNTSSLQNPIVVYPETGCFNVTLIATNAAGTHAVTKPCYIHVQTTSTEEQNAVFNRFVVFPNPVSDGRLNVEFELAQYAELKFFVVDNRGAVVKQLLHRQVKEGLNNLAFNTDLLVAGTYYLVVSDARNAVLKNQKFIVGN